MSDESSDSENELSIIDDQENDEGMSEEEEELINRLLAGEDVGEEDSDLDFNPSQSETISSCESQTSDADGITDPLAKPDIVWKDENVDDTQAPDARKQPFKPVRTPGLQLGRFTRTARTALKTPLHFFKLFISVSIIERICEATNLFAEEMHFQNKCTTYFSGPGKTWVAVSVDEMYRFIGILVYMSIVKLPTLARYWKVKSKIYRGTIIPDIMSRTRFQSILSFIQIVPSEQMNKDDKLKRIRMLLDHLKQKAQEFFCPGQDICIDERMLPSKHHYSGIRQFMKDKPVRFGFKLWVLSCSKSGYTYDFNVYLGKKHSAPRFTNNGVAYNAVMELIEPFLNSGYHLYMDSFFITRNLVNDLLSVSTYVIGTVKISSTAMPLALKDVKIWEKYVNRGDFRWVRWDKYVVVQWKDSQTVSVLSTIHSGSEITTCSRTLKSRVQWDTKSVKQPKAIADYNANMGGVDQSNQFLGKYPTYLKTKFHWWKVFLFHCIDISVVNSYILYKKYCEKFQIPLSANFGQLEFRESLVESLLGLDELDQSQNNRCMPVKIESRLNCKYCYSHFKVETKTTFMCNVCNVPLCITQNRNCFIDWHETGSSQNKRMKFC